MEGEIKDVFLLDVISTSVGLETKGGIFTKLIPRNTTIPAKRSEIFTTAEDNQSSIKIQVLQGEQVIATENSRLGVFELMDISPAPHGVPQIEVIFDVDANGIVHVSAKDLFTGKQQAMTVLGETMRAASKNVSSGKDADRSVQRELPADSQTPSPWNP